MIIESNSLISPKEWDIIRGVDQDHPDKKIMESFDLFLSTNPDDRPALAKQKRKETLRRGYSVRGIPIEDTETVDQHVMDMKELAVIWLYDYPQKGLPRLVACMDKHDDPEVITTDIIPGDGIKSSHKASMEYAGIKVIYEVEPHSVALWCEYADKLTLASHTSKDMDVFQLLLRCNTYEVTHPHIDVSGMTNDCHAYAWKTKYVSRIYKQIMPGL